VIFFVFTSLNIISTYLRKQHPIPIFKSPSQRGNP